MSVRLQVLLGQGEMERYRRLASEGGVPLATWVRMALRAAARDEPGRDFERKLAALDAACGRSFPMGRQGRWEADADGGLGRAAVPGR